MTVRHTARWQNASKLPSHSKTTKNKNLAGGRISDVGARGAELGDRQAMLRRTSTEKVRLTLPSGWGQDFIFCIDFKWGQILSDIVMGANDLDRSYPRFQFLSIMT